MSETKQTLLELPGKAAIGGVDDFAKQIKPVGAVHRWTSASLIRVYTFCTGRRVYTYIYIYIYVYMMYIYIHIYTHIIWHTYVSIYIYIIYIYIYICIIFMYIYIYVYIYIYIYIYIFAHGKHWAGPQDPTTAIPIWYLCVFAHLWFAKTNGAS